MCQSLGFPVGRQCRHARLMGFDDSAQYTLIRELARVFATECAALGMTPEDLAHEAVIRLSTRHTLLPQEESGLRSFLYVTLRHLVRDCMDKAHAAKRGGGKVTSLDTLIAHQEASSAAFLERLPGTATTPSKALIRAEQRKHLDDLIDTLPPNQNAAIRLRFFHDLSVEAIAETMGTTSKKVANYLRHGLEGLRKLSFSTG